MKLTKSDRRILAGALELQAGLLVGDVRIYARKAARVTHPRQRPDLYPNRAFWAGARLAAIGRLLLALREDEYNDARNRAGHRERGTHGRTDVA